MQHNSKYTYTPQIFVECTIKECIVKYGWTPNSQSNGKINILCKNEIKFDSAPGGTVGNCNLRIILVLYADDDKKLSGF